MAYGAWNTEYMQSRGSILYCGMVFQSYNNKNFHKKISDSTLNSMDLGIKIFWIHPYIIETLHITWFWKKSVLPHLPHLHRS